VADLTYLTPVYCLDRLEAPDEEFLAAQKRADPEFGGALHYQRLDVRNVDMVNDTMAAIASHRNRLDGLIAAAGVNHVGDAIDHSIADIVDVMSINYTGVFVCATAAAKQMLAYKCRGSVLLVASMSGLVANKGMVSPVYNSSKAAVMQLGRSLAMEWGRVDEQGRGGIRVNSLCPGHIVTPMVEETLKEVPESRDIWEAENMLGRLARPEEFRGTALFLLSDASSFMTGSSLVIDGGHTAW
jgi:NAD(P)-dependent dehydrogenase (short-subunit alcohol dehydrogenase family)